MESDDDLGAHFQKELRRILPELCEIEKEVLTLRFGLVSGKPSTLSDIAIALSTSISQIEEVQESLLTLIRHPSRSQVLRDYLRDDSFKTSNYDEVVNIVTRSPSRGIFASDFEAFFDEIFVIDEDENIVNGIRVNDKYIDEYFENEYGRQFNSEEMSGESLYENLCKGYFSWSSEFDFLIELTLDKWIHEDPIALEMNFSGQPTWTDKVGFAIALTSNILNADPLDLSFNYMVSSPRENYFTGLLPFEARAMLDRNAIVEGFVSRNVRVNSVLLPHISKASDQYALDYKDSNRDAEARVLFYLADLISRVYWLARWGCTYENDAY